MRILYLDRKHIFLLILIILSLIFIISNFVSVIYITGTSMEPKINHHDIIVLKDNPKNMERGDNILIPDDRFPVFHKIVYINDTDVVTKGTNVSYRDEPTSVEKIIGKQIYVIETPKILKQHITPIVMADSYRELEKIHN